jgi:chromosome segregation ATPase
MTLEHSVDDAATQTQAEQALARLRMEAGRIAIELNQAERDLDAARDARAETEKELEATRGEVAAARDELAKEREQRERLERQVEELRMEVKEERERSEREIEGLRSAAEITEAPNGHDEADLEGPSYRERALGQLMDALKPESESGTEPPSAEARESGEQRMGRFRRRKRVFQARGRACAVCRTTEALSPGQLKAEGWALGAEIDLCPGCQSKGWQLPRGGSLPFRRSHDRDSLK